MANPNSTVSEIPNPMTPMAFLPPDIAYQTTVSSYILVGSLGALVWDILTNLSNDYKLLFKHRIRLPTVVYFLARLSALAYVLASSIFETAPINACQKLEKIVDIFYPLAVPFSSLLFFFRIQAVFANHKYVVAFSFLVWLGVLGGSLTIVTAVTAINIGPTHYCLNASLKPYAGAAPITALIHDTYVFIAISWRLLSNSAADARIKDKAKAFISGEYMPMISRSLLQDGQLYYLITVGSNLLTVIMVYNTAVPVTYQTMFTVPNIMLTNAMACHVFRSTKFGLIKGFTTNVSSFSAGQSFPIPLHRSRNNRDSFEMDHTTSGIAIKVTEITEESHDRDHCFAHDRKAGV